MGNAQPASPRPKTLYPRLGPQIPLGESIDQENSCAAQGQVVEVCYPNGEFEALSANNTNAQCCFIATGSLIGTAFTNGICAGCRSGG